MTENAQFVTDYSWLRPRQGNIVLAGSPRILFSLSDAGKEIAECLERAQPLPQHHGSLTDRLVSSGAIHPVPSPEDHALFQLNQVTAVIPAFIRSAHEAQALQTLVLSCHTLHAVIVIDDASPYDLPDMATAQIIRLNTNQGPAAARNAGLLRVNSEFVTFIDTDVSLSQSTISALLPYFSDNKVGLVAPRVMSPATSSTLSKYEATASSLDMGDTQARIAPGTRVSYAPTAMWLCRTSALQSIQGFDESLRAGEDVDALWRLHAANWRCRYQPQSVCNHAPRTSLPQFAQQRYFYGRSAAPLATRHQGKLRPVKLNIWHAATWLFVLLGMPLVALGIATANAAAIHWKLRNYPQLGVLRIKLAFVATAQSGLAIARACGREWWPILIAAAIFSLHLRILLTVALVAPAIFDWRRQRIRLDPVRFTLLKILDDAAYGAGVWRGMISSRSIASIIPMITRSTKNGQ